MLIFCKNKKVIIAIIINLTIAFLLNELLKIIFQRIRPDSVNWLIDVNGYSFPSGHTMVSMSYYGFLIYLIYLSKLKYKAVLISALSLIIIFIGLSRVYLGVHYLSDILGGFIVSIMYLIIYITIYEKITNST